MRIYTDPKLIDWGTSMGHSVRRLSLSPYKPNLDSAPLIKVTAFQFWGQTCLHLTSDVPFLRERQLGLELSLASKPSILTSLKQPKAFTSQEKVRWGSQSSRAFRGDRECELRRPEAE